MLSESHGQVVIDMAEVVRLICKDIIRISK